MGQRIRGPSSGLDATIAISVFALALALRIPVMTGPLAGEYAGPAATLHAGLRVFKTSPFALAPPIENTFVNIFAYNYDGIWSWFLQFSWLLIANAFQIQLTMSTYFLGFVIMGAGICPLLFFINRILFSRSAGILTALLWVTLPEAVYDSINPVNRSAYLGFFEGLTLVSLASFYHRPCIYKLYGASGAFAFLILGDPSFPLKFILMGILAYFVYLDCGIRLKRSDVLRLVALPAGALIIDIAVFIAAVYKGHPMGLLAYILWYRAAAGAHRGWSLWYTFLSNFALPNGVAIFGFFLLGLGVMGWMIATRGATTFQKYFFASHAIFLPLSYLFFSANRSMNFLHFSGCLMLGSTFAQGRLHGGIRVIGWVLFVVTISLQTIFALNVQRGFLPEPFNYYYKNLREARLDVGQKAVGYWIREGAGRDSVLIVTPGDLLGFRDQPPYVFGSELYFGKTYCVCKGLSGKSLFTLKHLFDQRSYIDWERAPVRVIVAYGTIDRPIEALENLVKRPLDYHLRAVVLDEKTKIATIWEHSASGQQGEVVEYQKKELEADFDRKYANLQSLSWSAYQGMWWIMP